MVRRRRCASERMSVEGGETRFVMEGPCPGGPWLPSESGDRHAGLPGAGGRARWDREPVEGEVRSVWMRGKWESGLESCPRPPRRRDHPGPAADRRGAAPTAANAASATIAATSAGPDERCRLASDRRELGQPIPQLVDRRPHVGRSEPHRAADLEVDGEVIGRTVAPLLDAGLEAADLRERPRLAAPISER